VNRFCVNGLGAHRIGAVPARGERSGPDLLVPEEASFVVRTNFLSQLTVKDGCDTYGGDCYLDALWRPVCIVRQTQVASWEQPHFDICYPPRLLHAATAPADLPEPVEAEYLPISPDISPYLGPVEAEYALFYPSQRSRGGVFDWCQPYSPTLARCTPAVL